MKLTDREKILLCMLAVVLVFTICLKIVIVPSLANISDMKIQLTDLDSEKNEIEITVGEFSDLDTLINDETVNLENDKYFYEDIDDVFADNLMQDYAEKYKIEITNFTFGSLNAEELTPETDNIKELLENIISQRWKLFDEEAVTDGNIQTSETSDASQAGGQNEISPMILCNITFTGDMEDVINMIDEINSSDKSIVVTLLEGTVTLNKFTGNMTVYIYYY